jgi:glycosyltransferase involved in cell wall biosynthesis
MAVTALSTPAPSIASQAAAPLHALFVHSGNIFGGVETLLIALARHRGYVPGFQPEFALAFGGRLRNELTGTGVPVHDLGPVRFRRPDRIARARRLVATLLRSADVCVTQSGWSHALFAPVARRAGVPVVLWAHGIGDPRHWLERLAARTPPDVCLANSHFTAGTISQRFPDRHVEVCYGPMDLPDAVALRSRRGAVRAALGTPVEAIVIAQAGRFESQKGYLEHVNALRFVTSARPWECWIIGDAKNDAERRFRARLKELAAAHRLNVRFLGERDDVPSVLGAADIYCQPNTAADAFGLTFAEALAVGLPVVTSPLGGALEIIDASCGRFVDGGDASALGAALSALINDDGRRGEMARAGIARVRQLVDPARQVPALTAVLASVARSHLS